MFKNTLKIMALVGLAVAICVTARAYAATPNKTESVVLAGGCFWGIEAVFQHTKGVTGAVSGYAGRTSATANYDAVSGGNTGHAEAVKITFDPAQISLDKLLDVFFTVAHNPTQLNYQGPDHGTQYRSAVFYDSPAQKAAVEKKLQKGFVTTLEPLTKFYEAESYHQNYAAENPFQPYIMIHDAPKVAKLQKTFPELFVK
jgi:peptide-methionine (S)-S-oxide reductase